MPGYTLHQPSGDSMSGMSSRFPAPDRLRGVAVMGILLMNIVGFGLPDLAYTAPAAWGLNGLADRLAWAISFVLVDGKMRGLFALLYGAGLAMMLAKARQAGEDGWQKAVIRSFWLGMFGLAHYVLLWWGDILSSYAIIGLLALWLMREQNITRMFVAAGLVFAVHFLILAGLMTGMMEIIAAANAPDASEESLLLAAQLRDDIGEPGSSYIGEQLTLYRGIWSDMVDYKIDGLWNWLTSGLLYGGLEILGFMLLGMALAQNGFLTGHWPRARYRTTALYCFLIGLPPMMALTYWVWASDFDSFISFSAIFGWSFPFRIPLTIGMTAILVLIMAGRPAGAFLRRLEAVGRLSLSNYLLTSLLMTAFFYGWGLGVFGALSRAQLYAIVPMVWALMLSWSHLWLMRFGIGPAEYLWRLLIRRTSAALRGRPH